MAERRMFAKTIVTSDAFLDMPPSTRCLYFTLGMFADDDGFVNNPKSIMRQIGASTDDMNVLIAKKFVIAFDTGVIVIKHWRIHNYIQADRYHPTKYQDELSTLMLDENKAYSTLDTPCIQDVSKTDTEVRLGKDSLGKDSVGKSNKKRFTPPSLSEVQSYIKEKGYHINAESFIAFYESKNWMVGKNKMSKWKSAVATWEQRWKEEHHEHTRFDEHGDGTDQSGSGEPEGWDTIFGA